MHNTVLYKQLFVIVLALGLTALLSCNGSNKEKRLPTDLIQNPQSAEGTKNEKMPAFSFDKEFHDFGRVIQGEHVSFGFKFKNTGDAMLLITSVGSSCGCAVASFPKEPLKPGDEGVVSVSFDSRGRRGMQVKTITLLANTIPNTKQLTIQANVITPETED